MFLSVEDPDKLAYKLLFGVCPYDMPSFKVLNYIPRHGIYISETTMREAITIPEIGFEDEPTIAVT